MARCKFRATRFPNRLATVPFVLLARANCSGPAGSGLRVSHCVWRPSRSPLILCRGPDTMPQDFVQRLQTHLGDQFTVTRELGGGGMSRLFLAREDALSRNVVVKVLPPEIASAASLARFEREIAMTAGLQHPHILPVITAGGGDDIFYYVTPYVRGESLRQRLSSGGPFEIGEGLRAIDELLGAVAHAHARGIAHRDIKPGNVLISEGHAVLADFGIARALGGPDDDAVPSLTHEASSPYVAPEGIGGTAADIYSCGAVAYELLCGSPPPSARSVESVVEELRDRYPTLRGNVARQLAVALVRALAVDEARRFATAAEFATALASAAAAGPNAKRLVLPFALAATAILAVWSLNVDGASSPATRADTSAIIQRGAGAVEPPALPTAAADSAAPRMPSTPVVLSVRDSAEEARREWRIGDATRLYAAHIAAHPDDAPANAAYAVLASWRADSSQVEELLAAAARALRDSSQLSVRERALVAGVAAMAERKFDTACRAYARAAAIAADFASWLGAAECRVNDDRVILGADAPVFRASYAEAVTAYRNAIRSAGARAPDFAYSRLLRASFIVPGRVRRGRDSTGAAWLAFPELIDDSVTFRPFRPGPRRVDPEEQARTERALTASRNFLRPVLIAWTNALPDDGAPREALAELLEMEGLIDAPRADGRTALSEIIAARRLSGAGADYARRARIHVRLLLRQAKFGPARAIADSALRTLAAAGNPLHSIALVPLAALLGRADLATQMLERQSATASRIFTGADGAVVDVPVAARRRSAAFAVRAAMGICDDGVRTAPGDIRDALDAILPAARRGPSIDQALLEIPVGLALACTGVSAAAVLDRPSTPHVGAARALALGRADEANARLAAIDQQRARGGTPDTIEWAAIESAVRLAVGDTARAIAILRRSLEALPVAPVTFLIGEGSAGAIGRVMATLADLSVATGDADGARRYANSVVELWSTADPALAATVARMRAIAGP